MYEFWDNAWTAILIFIFIWIYGWGKGNLGSAKLAIIFALIIVYLTFYSFPELVWLIVGIYFFANFGKDIIAKINPFGGGGLGEGHPGGPHAHH